MLKFYYNSRSPMARRVWRYLLEKGIEFEEAFMKLNGDHLQPEYLEINPFHHIPVIVDNDFRVIESLAILDYLEAKYPTPSLLPKDIHIFANTRMVQMVSTNELIPKVIPLLFEPADSPQVLQNKQHLNTVLKFFAHTLGNQSFFGGENLSLADIVAGTDISFLPRVGIHLNDYPNRQNWFDRLMAREIWQKTELNAEEFEQFRRVLSILIRKSRKK